MAEGNRSNSSPSDAYNEFENLLEELKTSQTFKSKTGKLVDDFRKIKEAEAKEAASANPGQLFRYRQS